MDEPKEEIKLRDFSIEKQKDLLIRTGLFHKCDLEDPFIGPIILKEWGKCHAEKTSKGFVLVSKIIDLHKSKKKKQRRKNNNA